MKGVTKCHDVAVLLSISLHRTTVRTCRVRPGLGQEAVAGGGQSRGAQMQEKGAGDEEEGGRVPS